MTFDTTRSAYNNALALVEQIGPLAESGDTDALQAVNEVVLLAKTLGRQLRRKIMEAENEYSAPPQARTVISNLAIFG